MSEDRTLVDLPVLTMNQLDADLAAALDVAGCCVVLDAASPDTMTAIANELSVFQDRASVGASDFEGRRTRRLGAPLPRSATFQSIAMHPAVMAAGDLILGHASSWRFSAAEYIEIGPGEKGQRLHRDQWKYDMVDFDCEVELNGMWAITDFTEANGATRMRPAAIAGPTGAVSVEATNPAEMPQGSLLLYTGSVYHGGGGNRSIIGEVACPSSMASDGSRSRRTSSSSVRPPRWATGLMSCCASSATPRPETDSATGETAKTRSVRSSPIETSSGAGQPSVQPDCCSGRYPAVQRDRPASPSDRAAR